MSNRSLKGRIEESLVQFRAGEIDMEALISSVESNGKALEGMPYSLVKELDEVCYQLEISQFYGDEILYDPEKGLSMVIYDEVDTRGALRRLESWLSKIPVENIDTEDKA